MKIPSTLPKPDPNLLPYPNPSPLATVPVPAPVSSLDPCPYLISGLDTAPALVPALNLNLDISSPLDLDLHHRQLLRLQNPYPCSVTSRSALAPTDTTLLPLSHRPPTQTYWITDEASMKDLQGELRTKSKRQPSRPQRPPRQNSFLISPRGTPQC
jgi:hypothetical protein